LLITIQIQWGQQLVVTTKLKLYGNNYVSVGVNNILELMEIKQSQQLIGIAADEVVWFLMSSDSYTNNILSLY